MKKTVGMMIKETLLEKNISLSTLGRGLCKKSDLSRYLNGVRRIDRLLLTVFLQRIGKSPAKFSLLLTEDEYAYFEWKHKICLAQMERKWELVEQLLKTNAEANSLFNEVLQKQYAQIMQAIVLEKLYGERKRCVEILQEAINMTVPDFHKGLKSDTLLGTQEICAILLWQKLQPDKEKSFLILKELVWYVDRNYMDMQEKVRVYPKVVAQYLSLLMPLKEYEPCLVLAEEVIQLMIKTGYANDMERFLQIYVESAEKLGISEKAAKRKRQLEAWQELMEDIGYVMQDAEDELFLLDVWQEIELLNEAMQVSRREYNYSQESLSQNICEPETISRIENGRSIPHQNTYKALAKKLALPEECYFTTIETDDFEVLELQWWLESLIMRRKWEEAEETLENLKNMLNIEEKKNLQYINEKRYIIDSECGRISIEQQLEYLTKVLCITMPGVRAGDWEKEKFWDHYFRKTEMSILINVVDVLLNLGRYKESLILLQHMYFYYKNRKETCDLHYRTVLLIVARLSSAHLECEEYDEALLFINEGIRMSIISGNQRLLSGLANNKAHALECQEQKEASLKYYRLAYYCADLMESNIINTAKRSYERLAGEHRSWY